MTDRPQPGHPQPGDPVPPPTQEPAADQPPPADQTPAGSQFPPVGGGPAGSPPPPIPRPDYPPTSQFPQVNYAPPGQLPDYGHQYAPGDHQPPPQGYPGSEPPPQGYPGSQFPPQDYPGNAAPVPGNPSFPPPAQGYPGYPPPAQGYPGFPPPPQGYPGYPPPPPARKSNAPLIAVIVAVAVLLCGGLATAGILVAHRIGERARQAVKPLTEPTSPDDPGLPTGNSGGNGSTGRSVKVTYQVTGDGPAQLIYVDRMGAAPTRLDDVKLPWSFSTTMQTPALVSIIAMRAGSTDGRLTCRALVDGQPVKEATSADQTFATAACTYFALD